MKHTFSYYYVQCRIDGKVDIVGHSENDETKEVYYKFLDKKKAIKLIEEERKLNPEYNYRLIKHTQITEESNWS